MKLTLKYLAIVFIGGTIISSCTKHPDSPGYEYAPDMYRSQAIEAYVDYGMVGDEERDNRADRLRNTQSARVPAEGTIPFHLDKEKATLMMPFIYSKDQLLEASSSLKIPSSFLDDIDGNVKEGKRLYDIMCMHCHGKTGDGDGGVVVVGDYNTPSPYSGPYKERSLGGIFHIITYGKGAMGAHASQLNKIERWKVSMYVRTLQHGDFNLEGLQGESDSLSGEEVSGESIFTGLGCIACHQMSEVTVGPSLINIASIYGGNKDNMRAFLKGEGEAIVDPTLFAVMQPQIPLTEGLKEEDLNKLVDYISGAK